MKLSQPKKTKPIKANFPAPDGAFFTAGRLQHFYHNSPTRYLPIGKLGHSTSAVLLSPYRIGQNMNVFNELCDCVNTLNAHVFLPQSLEVSSGQVSPQPGIGPQSPIRPKHSRISISIPSCPPFQQTPNSIGTEPVPSQTSAEARFLASIRGFFLVF